jgi:hypothetical protein
VAFSFYAGHAFASGRESYLPHIAINLDVSKKPSEMNGFGDIPFRAWNRPLNPKGIYTPTEGWAESQGRFLRPARGLSG